jgi:hypothetical protein
VFNLRFVRFKRLGHSLQKQQRLPQICFARFCPSRGINMTNISKWRATLQFTIAVAAAAEVILQPPHHSEFAPEDEQSERDRNTAHHHRLAANALLQMNKTLTALLE